MVHQLVDGIADSYFIGFDATNTLLSTSRVSSTDLVVALRMKSKDSQDFHVLDEGYLQIVTVTTVTIGILPSVSRRYGDTVGPSFLVPHEGLLEGA